MHDELIAEGYDVAIVGVNEVGQESGNAGIEDVADLPWLQDTAAVDAWGEWGAQWRDVFLADEDGALLAEPYNLTEHDLAEDYDELKGMITDAAGG